MLHILMMENYSYFRRILFILSSKPFYSKYVHLPGAETPLPHHFRHNPKFWPFFKDALGAIDGSHIHSAPPASERIFYRNRKGFISQNCLFACSFSLLFVYALTGWEGSATDARVWEDARLKDLVIPDDRYYLADAGFPSCKEVLLPYRGIRYHLAEWGRAGIRYILLNLNPSPKFIHVYYYRPTTKEELFNLRHASARNVIERIFGVLKRRFRILHIAPEYNLEVQARIPVALSALHNFIRIHDPEEGSLSDIHNHLELNGADGNDDRIEVEVREHQEEVDARRNRIAEAMWVDYQHICQERGQVDIDYPMDSDDELDDEEEM
jgi:hypothetical protein